MRPFVSRHRDLLQPRLRLSEVGEPALCEDAPKRVVELLRDDARKVWRIQKIEPVSAGVLRHVSLDVVPLRLRERTHHPTVPPAIWVGGDEALFYQAPHSVGIELQALDKCSVIAFSHRQPRRLRRR